MKMLENTGNRGQEMSQLYWKRETGIEPAERRGCMKTDQHLSRTHWGTLVLLVFKDTV